MADHEDAAGLRRRRPLRFGVPVRDHQWHLLFDGCAQYMHTTIEKYNHLAESRNHLPIHVRPRDLRRTHQSMQT